MILLIGNLDDPHLISIQEEIKILGHNSIILNTSREGLLETDFFYSSVENDFFIKQKNITLNLKDITSVFCISPLYSKKGFVSSQNKEFWHFSWREALYGYFYNLTHSAFFINRSVQNSIAMQNKISFFNFAKHAGIKTPNSIITNNKEEIKDFFKNTHRVVIKTMHQIYLEYNGEQTMMLVKEVGEEQFNSFENDGESPLFLQQKIHKEFDIRVIIIGKEIFACKIDASQSKYGCLDWRAYDLPNTKHSVYQLPITIQNQLIQIMKCMQLDYACLDFCVDSDGEYWLLDINPFGKYMWIELALGVPISRKIASFLCEMSYMSYRNIGKN